MIEYFAATLHIKYSIYPHAVALQTIKTLLNLLL